MGLLVATFCAATGSRETSGTPAPQAVGRTGQYGEAPMLAAMVANGELPPVEDRLPAVPFVHEMIEGVGNYGGDLVVLAVGQPPNNNDLQGQWSASLLRIPRSGVGVEPDIAEGYEVVDNDEGKPIGIKFFLREGMKWSDGSPFTSEDIRFMFEDMHQNPNVQTWGSWGINRVVVDDDFTVTVIKDGGLGTGLLQASSWFGGYSASFQPSAYLKPYHIDYNADAQTDAEAAGYETWYDRMRDLYFWNPMKNPEKPQVEPWDLAEFDNSARIYVRNPYFHRIDSEGNQLPYIDRMLIQVVDNEVYQLKVTGGEASIAYQQLSLDNMQLYRGNESAGDYTTYIHPGVNGSELKLISNMTHPDPIRRAVHQDVRFRQAVSVAVNRAEIQKVIYADLGVARQLAPIPSASFYDQSWGEYYAQYDPALANRLLDEMGLNRRDSDGFRRMSDGRTLSIVLSYTSDIYTAELELISEYLNAVGIKTTIGLVDVSLLTERRILSEYDFWIHPQTNQPQSSERGAFGNATNWASIGYAWEWDNAQRWGGAKTAAVQAMLGQGVALPPDWRRLETPTDDEIEFEAPPEWWIDYKELSESWADTAMGSAEYERIAKEYFGYAVENLFMIGFVGMVPNLLIAKNDLGNVIPPNYASGQGVGNELIQPYMDQLYWK